MPDSREQLTPEEMGDLAVLWRRASPEQHNRILAALDEPLSVPLTDGRLRAALANHRPLIREWLDAEDLADALQASEGADTPSAQDTEDAAQHYRSRVAAALATPAPEPGWFDCGDPECGSCPRPREDEHHRMMKARRLATPAPEPGIDVERLAAALHRGLPFKCDPSIVADIAREYAALAIPSREKGEA